MKPYNVVNVSEILGIEVMEEDLQLCYTPKSHLAPRLLDKCEQYKLDNPFRYVTYLGDFF